MSLISWKKKTSHFSYFPILIEPSGYINVAASYVLTGDHNIVHNCRGLIPLNSKLVNTLSILREASNLDTSSFLRHLAAKMHIAFLSNPASGQLNVQMATATKLVSEGHHVTFLSADSCAKKIDQLRAGVQPFHQGLIDFIGLGTSHNVSD